VLFVDIRGSKELSNKHNKPVLAKIYRSYISEVIAVLRGNIVINEIYIEGDGVWAVFNTTSQDQVNSVFCTAFTISSLVDILNVKLNKKGYQPIEIGIGIEYAESLYIKAGYSGSGINEVVWIGKVVGEAARLCSFASKDWNHKIMVSTNVYPNLTDKHKGLLQWNTSFYCYHGNVINVEMNEWVTQNA
jgi:class 3 adenylate cyclase